MAGSITEDSNMEDSSMVGVDIRASSRVASNSRMTKWKKWSRSFFREFSRRLRDAAP
jgi:hypothetical protein